MCGDAIVDGGAGQAKKVAKGSSVETELGRESGFVGRTRGVGHGGRRRGGAWRCFGTGGL